MYKTMIVAFVFLAGILCGPNATAQMIGLKNSCSFKVGKIELNYQDELAVVTEENVRFFVCKGSSPVCRTMRAFVTAAYISGRTLEYQFTSISFWKCDVDYGCAGPNCDPKKPASALHLL